MNEIVDIANLYFDGCANIIEAYDLRVRIDDAQPANNSSKISAPVMVVLP
jgi:hypothetical protein